MKGSVYTVCQVNNYIKNMFTQDFLLSKLKVNGEVSNCKYHSSGHIYFSLKDASGAIACVMFAGQRKGLAFSMKNGDQVIVTGNVNVYPRDGRYQLYASEITLAGAGELYEKFLALKNELEEMGMFAPEYKQPIPKGIRTLGVVTASTGAAIRDILSVAKRRNPGIRIILYPAQVQGEGAVPSIVRGIKALDKPEIDTIIVGRGGGSIEDLWAFNEEAVARAIFHCSRPIISAVGHETDVTIADFVADVRAATPSAAAELAVDDVEESLRRICQLKQRMQQLMMSRIQIERHLLSNYKTKLTYLSPKQQIQERRQLLVDCEKNLRQCMEAGISEKRHYLEVLITQMKGLSPLDKLNQGYSYTQTFKGETLHSVKNVKTGDQLKIYVQDGIVDAMVLQTHEKMMTEG